MPFLEHVRVIVRELLPRLDIANRLDPDAIFIDHGIAVRIAGVIEEARVVPVDGGVDHHMIVDGEEIGVMPLTLDVRIPRVGLGRSEPLSRILDEARARGNAARRKATEPLNTGFADLEGN